MADGHFLCLVARKSPGLLVSQETLPRDFGAAFNHARHDARLANRIVRTSKELVTVFGTSQSFYSRGKGQNY